MKIKALVMILIITAFSLGCFEEEEKNHAPVARAEANKTTVNVGEEVQFSASKSSDEDGDELFFIWDFDDSNGRNDTDSKEETTTYRYWDAGDGEKKYVVTLTVSDGELLDTDEITITVKKPPSRYVCDFTAKPKGGIVNETDDDTLEIKENTILVTFNASNSCDTDAKIISYEWDFSFNQTKGFISEEKGVEVEKDFVSGLYPVMLKIENDKGIPNTKLEYIRIHYSQFYQNLSVNYNKDALVNFPINTFGAEKVIVTLTYDDGRGQTPIWDTDMDLYVYNTSADKQSDDNEVGNSTEHDRNNKTQVNNVEITDEKLLNEKEETIWSVKVDCTDVKSGDVNCDLSIEVYYKNKL